MEFLIVGITVFYTIILIVCICRSNKNLKVLTEKKIEDFNSETARKCEEIKKQKQQEIDIFSKELDNKIEKLTIQLEEKEKRYKEVNKDLEIYKQNRLQDIDNTTEEYKQKELIKIKQVLEQNKLNANSDFNNYVDGYMIEKGKLEAELETIRNKLEEERSKRAAINEEIRKQEEVERYNEIHSVSLTDAEKEDIHFLLSLEDRMHNKQILYKLVWSQYLQQAYKNTFNNILGNKNPKNVIYCIENIKNGKKYIGKTSAEVSKRWTEHIKTSLNIGSIKSTNIHKALYNHWDEFIFYIIMETEKDKLSEMEKYYIKFYESDKYGYNIKAGG